MKMNKETLDVGCGDHPRGTVNIDCRTDQYFTRQPLKTKSIPNFIKADAYHLPFRNGAFRKVMANHVLEHLQNPVQALKEWKRVAETTVIAVPGLTRCRFTQTEFAEHLYTWSISSLKTLMETVYSKVTVTRQFQPFKWKRKTPLVRIINFLIYHLLSYLRSFQDVDLIAVGSEN